MYFLEVTVPKSKLGNCCDSSYGHWPRQKSNRDNKMMTSMYAWISDV